MSPTPQTQAKESVSSADLEALARHTAALAEATDELAELYDRLRDPR